MSLSLRTCLLAVAVPALARGAAAGSPRDQRLADLAVARDAVEHGVYLFASEPLERLAADVDFERSDEATMLLARARFGLGDYNTAAGLLEGYEEKFRATARLSLEAAYWRAMTDVRRAADADMGSAERRGLLRAARKAFRQVIDESADPVLLAGARLQLGVVLYMEEEFEEALRAFGRAERFGVAPKDRHELRMYFGRANLGLGDFAEAARDFEELVRSGPKGPLLAEAYYGLGDARYYLEEWEKAAAAYEKAGESRSLGALSRYGLGWAASKLGEQRRREGDLPGAGRAWSRAFEGFNSFVRDPAAPVRMRDSAAFEAARALFRLGRYPEAAGALVPLTDFVRYPAQAPGALYLLGKCRTALGQLPEAIASFERVIELDKMKDAVAVELKRQTLFALAEALVERGSLEEAHGRLGALEAEGQPPSVRAEAIFEMAGLARRAAAACREDDPAKAAGYYAQAYESFARIQSDQTLLAERSAGEVAYWQGRSAHDRAALDLADADLWFGRAVVAYRMVAESDAQGEWREKALADGAGLERSRGRLDAAARVLRELLGVPGLASERELAARLDLADVELDLGRPSSALEILAPVRERAALSAGREGAHYRSAAARFDMGEYERALGEHESFLKTYPESGRRPDAMIGLADCLRRLDRLEESIAFYETTLREYPEHASADHVRLVLGDVLLRNSGDADGASALYSAIFEDGRDPKLRARAGLELAKVLMLSAERREALGLLNRAEVLSSGPVVHEIAEYRGTILVSLGRHAEGAGAFALAARSEEPSLRARARYGEAGALLALGKSDEVERPAEVLRRSARGFTWVVYNSPDEGLRERAIFEGVQALVELASVEEAAGRAGAAKRELEEAKGILALSANAAKAASRTSEIEARLRSLGTGGASERPESRG